VSLLPPHRYRKVSLGGASEAQFTYRPDGSLLIRATERLDPYPSRLTDRLQTWANEAPDRTFVAKRGVDGQWRRITYADMLFRVRAIAQSLLERRLSSDRPIAVLSGNDLDHLQLALAAMWAGIPHSPISPAYSLLSQDYGKLRHALGVLTPGLVFAASGTDYEAAILACVPVSTELVLSEGEVPGRRATRFDELSNRSPSAAVDAAYAKVGPDTIAKFLFTSGSTRLPKAVITTQRMLCSNQQMLLQCLRFLGEEPPVLLDWLPWNHTFGGSHNVGLVLYNGGTLYIDDGRPTAARFEETVKNLREIAPTVYFNVPKGWEDLAGALERDFPLRARFFSQVKLLFYSGASLPQTIWDRLDQAAEATCGQRIRMITGLGMTETAPSSMFTTGPVVKAGYVGLPAPGCDTKLTPMGEKLEVRFRGPHVMPGYWRAPDQTRDAFDDEGYYRTGDALKLADPAQPQWGLYFDGRTTDDFKLSSGTFVSVGPLVQRVITEGSPYVDDAVVAGLNRNEVGVLIFPREDTCRMLAGARSDALLAEVLSTPAVSAFFQGLVDRLFRSATGSADRVARVHVLSDRPSLENGEITDKGSINQQAVLTRRAALVDALYSGSGAVRVMLPGRP
jgi:feruloyl-CoA synthase